MSECLLIRIHPEDSSLSFVWLNKNNHSNNDLAKAADACDLICVLTPATHLFLTAVSLPPLNPNRLLKAIPYALEDQLGSETKDLHFAFLRNDKTLPVSVGAVSIEQMQAWIDLLKDAIPNAMQKIQAFIPDCLCLPYAENQASILVDDVTTLVRTGEQLGFSAETSSIIHPLTQWVRNHKPQKITVYYTKEPLPLPEMGIPIEQQKIDSALTFLAQNTVIDTTLNLLQNEFAPQHTQIGLWQLTRLAILLLSAWLCVLTIWNIADIVLLKREELALSHQIAALYGLTHPNMAIPDEPKLSLQKELASLRASHKDSNFIRLISHLTEFVPNLTSAGVELQTLTFRSNQMVLMLSTPDLKPIENLQQSLEQKGLKATLSNAERSGGNRIQVRLTVEELS